MARFYFNTGVTPDSGARLCRGQVWRGGTMQIPFDTDEDVPEGSVLLFASDTPDCEEASQSGVLVVAIRSEGLASEYAYFRKKELKP